MALSNTVRKTVDLKSIQLATVDTVAELAAIKVARWQKRETARLLSTQSNNVYIFPTKRGYKIGGYTITNAENHWEVRSRGECERFSTKAQAVIWTTLSHKSKHTLAREFKDAQRLVDKYLQDIMYYKHSIRCSKDDFRRGALWNRVEDALFHLQLAQNNLRKTLNSAKYIKLWEENNHENFRDRPQSQQ